MISMFKLEIHLVNNFNKLLNKNKNNFEIENLAFEFYYMSGRVDIIGKTNNGELITFEAKINKWRYALHQAYRNSSFAHYSYVLLPESNIKNALKNQYEFERRGIGLCSVDFNRIKIEIPASKKKPILPWLTNSAFNYLNEQYHDIQTIV